LNKGTAGAAASCSNELVRLGEVTTLLGGKSNVGHTHTAGEVTGLAEAVGDAVGSLVEDTSSVAFSYDDAGDSLAAVVRRKAGDICWWTRTGCMWTRRIAGWRWRIIRMRSCTMR